MIQVRVHGVENDAVGVPMVYEMSNATVIPVVATTLEAINAGFVLNAWPEPRGTGDSA